jgi:hypothetical protein
MKKVTLIVSAFLMFSIAKAQETLNTGNTSFISKNGYEVLPKAGEFGLSFSATSFLNYAGNLFMGTSNAPVVQAPGGFNDPMATTGNIPASFVLKYFYTDNFAVRSRLQLNYNNIRDARPIPLSTNNFNPRDPKFGEDVKVINSTAVMIGLGMEKRRGSQRVQGIYGAELILGFFNENNNYNYANAMTEEFPTPWINDFGGNGYFGDTRLVQDKFGNRFFAGIRGFAGVEYFFAPKISLGGEFGYTIGMSTRGERVQVREYYDGATSAPKSFNTRTQSNRVSSFGAAFDQINAAISLNFYF